VARSTYRHIKVSLSVWSSSTGYDCHRARRSYYEHVYIAQRVVAISSMDVYRAYGVILGIESVEPVPLTEDSSVRLYILPGYA